MIESIKSNDVFVISTDRDSIDSEQTSEIKQIWRCDCLAQLYLTVFVQINIEVGDISLKDLGTFCNTKHRFTLTTLLIVKDHPSHLIFLNICIK